MMNNTYDIEQLLQYKSFDELNKNERSYVLSFMTSDSYTEMRQFILKINKELPNSKQSIQPRPQTYLKLRQYLLAERPTIQHTPSWTKYMEGLLQSRIPVYKVATSLLFVTAALFLSLQLFTQKNTSLTTPTTTSPKIVSPFDQSNALESSQPFNPNPNHQLVYPSNSTTQSIKSSMPGISYKEDSVMMQLLIEAH